jgi:hypothetical protein
MQPSRPRQDPVSCESCRKKKLKCSRQQPCSNCTARGIPCDFKVATVQYTRLQSNTEPEDVSSLRSENVAIKARLERLEELIYSNRNDVDPAETRPSKARKIDTGSSAFPSPSTSITANTPDSEVARSYKGDFQWLEGVGECGVHYAPRIPLTSRRRS